MASLGLSGVWLDVLKRIGTARRLHVDGNRRRIATSDVQARLDPTSLSGTGRRAKQLRCSQSKPVHQPIVHRPKLVLDLVSRECILTVHFRTCKAHQLPEALQPCSASLFPTVRVENSVHCPSQLFINLDGVKVFLFMVERWLTLLSTSEAIDIPFELQPT